MTGNFIDSSCQALPVSLAKSNEKIKHSATPSLLSSTLAEWTICASSPARAVAATNALGQRRGSCPNMTGLDRGSKNLHFRDARPHVFHDSSYLTSMPCLWYTILHNFTTYNNASPAASTSFFRRDTQISARFPHARAVANNASWDCDRQTGWPGLGLRRGWVPCISCILANQSDEGLSFYSDSGRLHSDAE